MTDDASHGTHMSPTMRCEKCLQPVIEGPDGGYVCGLCYHVVEPWGYEERRKAGIKEAAQVRREKTEVRRQAKERKMKSA